MADGKSTRTIELEEGEVALIFGEDGESMSIRVAAADELEDEEDDITDAAEIVVALATRLLNDPDFHDQVLDWYHAHGDDEEPDAE
jgi:hypothetical protein